MIEMEKLLYRPANERSETLDRRFFIGSFLYTKNIVKAKINFPLF